MIPFVHLHVHSDYSLTDSTASIKALAEKASEFGMSHLALTDHGNMFGIMEFISACEDTRETANSVKPIIGCEVYVSPSSRFLKKGNENENKYHHLVLLAYNRQGYFNLVRLCSLAYTEGFYYRPRIDDEILEQYHEGLIALSACASGEISRLIQGQKPAEAQKKAEQYRKLFGKDTDGNPCFYLELQDHGIPSGGLKGSDMSQSDINMHIVDISRKTGIPLVATNDVHYINRDDYIAHDVMLCIGTGKNRSDEKRKKYSGDQFYFKTGDEMARLFSDYPEAIENTVKIANRCVCDVPKYKPEQLAKYLPDFEIPSGFDSPASYLRQLTVVGLEKRYQKEKEGEKWDEIQNRAQYELDTIIDMGFTGYFLIVWDFVKWANDNGIIVGPGRGSGAGSIVAYALRITNIDPLKYNLLFERFLNPDRISMPDFDIDFANEGRDEVINYVISKYGKDRVGQIITFGTLGAKAVIKDVARVLGISIPESDMITKLISKDPKINLKKAFEDEARLRELAQDERYKELFELAFKLEGLNRHSSLHAAGIVIGNRPLIELVPLYQERDDAKTGKSGGIATQYSMNYLEPCGLVKMDFLGLKTLDVIKHVEELIRKRGGKYSRFSVEDCPENDEATYKMLAEGKSFEVFQFESDGMQNILKQTKPNSIEDLTALNAMYRPGPMQNIPRYIDSKTGRQAVSYPDPKLESILKETYGVIVYQEQVMETAKIIAGYTMGQADLLRRAMSKKKAEVLEKEKVNFLAGAEKQGYSRRKAEAIYEMLIPFAGYGFNKSHAAAYSVIAYHTAYLKAHFPYEFMAANLSNDIHSADKNKLSQCIDEARRMGITIDPPDVNRSDKLFAVADGHIIYGLLGIKGLGEAPAQEIVRARKDSPYTGFIDFLEKIDIKTVGKKVIEYLVNTGAFDNFGVTRETLAGNLERAAEYAQKKKEDIMSGQAGLFDDIPSGDFPDFQYEEFPQMSRVDRLNLEKQLIGFYFSGHPMDEYRDLWRRSVKVNLADTNTLIPGNCVLIGIINGIKTFINGRGNKMTYAVLADYNGGIDCVFFSDAWQRCQHTVENDKVAVLQGKIDYQKDKDKYSFIVDNCVPRQDVDAVVKETAETERKNESYKNTWAYMADLKSGSLSSALKGNYTVIGFIRSLREFKDKNGEDMAFGTLQDFEGGIDIVFFSKTYAKYRDFLKLDDIIALKGSIDPERPGNQKKVSLIVSSVADMAQLNLSANKKAASGEKPPQQNNKKKNEIHIKLAENISDDDESFYELRDYLSANKGSACLYIHIPVNGAEKKIVADNGLKEPDNSDIMNELKKYGCITEIWRV
jgi:DNA polymerase-3 subunit alpha